MTAFALSVHTLVLGISGLFGIFTGTTTGMAIGLAALQVLFFPLFGAFRLLGLIIAGLRTAWAPAIIGIALYTNTIGVVMDSTTHKLNTAYDKIRGWGNSVIGVFADIYDKVIGHSWWTDTMDGIVKQTKGLTDRVSTPLKNFSKFVKGVFEDISKNGMPKFRKDTSFVESITNIKEQLVSAFNRAAEEFPETLRTVLVGISGLLVYALFPASVLRTHLLIAIGLSFAAGAALMSERFGKAFSDSSTVQKIGYGLGSIVGYFVGSFIREIPQILNALLGMAAGFVRGFVEQLPLIGVALKSAFDITSIFGLAGPLGLFMLYIFGKSTSTLFGSLKITKDLVEGISKTFSYLAKVLRGRAGGYVVEFLFGTFGPFRILSAIGLIFTMMGSFDSLLSNSIILKTFAAGGLFWMMLNGKDGYAQIKGLISLVLAPAFLAIKQIIGATAGTTGVLYNLLYGPGGNGATGQAISKGLDKFSRSLINTANTIFAPLANATGSLIASIFFGGDKKKALDAATGTFETVKKAFKDFTTKLGEDLLKNDIFKRFWEGADGTSGLKAKYEKIKGAIGLGTPSTKEAGTEAAGVTLNPFEELAKKAAEGAAGIQAAILSTINLVGKTAGAAVQVATTSVGLVSDHIRAGLLNVVQATAGSVSSVVEVIGVSINTATTLVNSSLLSILENVEKTTVSTTALVNESISAVAGSVGRVAAASTAAAGNLEKAIIGSVGNVSAVVTEIVSSTSAIVDVSLSSICTM
jgi:hypothetical protein